MDSINRSNLFKIAITLLGLSLLGCEEKKKITYSDFDEGVSEPATVSLSVNNLSSATVKEKTLSITFSASANKGLDRIECNLNSVGYVTCTSPYAMSNMNNGDYSLDIRAVDSQGNYSSVENLSWTVNTAKNAKNVDSGFEYNCMVTTGKNVKCWGKNDSGQLGNSATSGTNQPNPVQVDGISNAAAISVGAYHACVLLEDRTVSCWGMNDAGQLGRGTSNFIANPIPQDIGLTDVVQVSAGFKHTCALLYNGDLLCWGQNDTYELGINNGGTGVLTPTTVLSSVESVGTGGSWPDFHSCALVTSGDVYCWGDNGDGQVGTGSITVDEKTPTQVTNLSNVEKLFVGPKHSCALENTGTLKCWGFNTSGQVGSGGASAAEPTPVTVGTYQVVSMGLGIQHSCMVLENQRTYCFGDNWAGQLGQGDLVARYNPTEISSLNTGSEVSSKGSVTCSLSTSHTVHCWGVNSVGEVGNGTTVSPVDTPDSTVNASL